TVAEGDVAVVLEHAALDVKLGRGKAAVDVLRDYAGRIKDRVIRERLLGLYSEAAIQAGRLDVAEKAEEERESLTTGSAAEAAIQLRRVVLLGETGRNREAEALAGGRVN